MATQLAGVPYAALPTAATVASALAFPPRLVVIHDTSNSATAQQEALYAASRPIDGATSAHFYVDGNGPLGSVPLNKQAWAAYSYANGNGFHIEMCGYNAGQRGAVPPVTIGHTARLVRKLCDLAGIPMVKLGPGEVAAGKRGICGHWDITTGLGVGTHDDPGPAFDWAAFIAAVNGDDMEQGDLLGKSGPTVGVALQSGYANTVAIRAAADALRADVAALAATVGAIAARVDLDPAELAALSDAARTAAAEGAKAGVLASADALVDALVAKLPGVTAEQVEAAVREVFADAGQAG